MPAAARAENPRGACENGAKMRTDMAWQFPSWRTQSTHVEARSNVAALDRDERRALSRHKSAIQLFDAFRVAPNTGRMSVTRLHFYVVLAEVHIGGPLEASMMIVNHSLNRRGNDTGS